MVSVSRQFCLALVLAISACSGPGEDDDLTQPTSKVPIVVAGAGESTKATRAPTSDTAVAGGAGGSLDSQQGLDAFPLVAGDEATVSQEDAGPIPGDLLPRAADEPDSLIRFVPFGAPAGVDPDAFKIWSRWLNERYLGDPDEVRKDELEGLLKQAHIVYLTPAYVNLIDGLDMADPGDVVLAGEVTIDWYLAQEKYKQIAIDRGPDNMRQATITGRVTALKAWVRWWQRTLANETVERYRTRVDALTRMLKKLRKERRGES